MAFGSTGRWDHNPKGRLFTARYDGSCADCGDLIEPGDEVGYVDNDLLCSDCWELL